MYQGGGAACARRAKHQVLGDYGDTQRTGFQVFLPKHDIMVLDPVVTLQDYIARTE